MVANTGAALRKPTPSVVTLRSYAATAGSSEDGAGMSPKGEASPKHLPPTPEASSAQHCDGQLVEEMDRAEAAAAVAAMKVAGGAIVGSVLGLPGATAMYPTHIM